VFRTPATERAFYRAKAEQRDIKFWVNHLWQNETVKYKELWVIVNRIRKRNKSWEKKHSKKETKKRGRPFKTDKVETKHEYYDAIPYETIHREDNEEEEEEEECDEYELPWAL
jgi:hypothetical protein